MVKYKKMSSGTDLIKASTS